MKSSSGAFQPITLKQESNRALSSVLNDENTILYIFQPSTVSQIVEARLLLIFIEYNFDASLLSACTLVPCLKANLFNYAI